VTSSKENMRIYSKSGKWAERKVTEEHSIDTINYERVSREKKVVKGERDYGVYILQRHCKAGKQ
jgi:hypothetical protein